MVGGTVARNYFPCGTDFYVYYGYDVAQFFVNDSLILRLDLLVSNGF
jgi:hypothetical protein